MASSRDKLENKIVIIPRGKGVKKYFEPRVVILRPRQTVTWINRDTAPHALTSGEPHLLISTNTIKTGLIRPGKSATLTIPSTIGNIPYFCSFHPSEKGTIVVTSKDENL